MRGRVPVDELGEIGVFDDATDRMAAALARFWLPVAYCGDVTDAPVGVELLGQRLVVARLRDGNVHAFRDLCPHRGTALSLGSLVDGCLRCPYHGWTYASDGACILIPSDPAQPIPSRARLQPFACVEASGLVWVCLAGGAPPGPPPFPEMGDPSLRLLPVPSYDWECGAMRRIENFMDLAHIPWVHDGVLGSSERPETPPHQVRRRETAIEMTATMLELPNLKSVAPGFDGAAVWTTSKWLLHMPVTLWWRQHLPEDRVYGIFLTASPITMHRCRTFSVLFRNFDFESDRRYSDFQLEIAEADRAIAESQRPAELPYDLTDELQIKGADQLSIEYRRWIRQLADGAAVATAEPPAAAITASDGVTRRRP
jgi:vanillate O-demethylase monooxygenase subunit